jgi:hypothetical protein
MKQRKARIDSVEAVVAAHSKKVERIRWPSEVARLSNPTDKRASSAYFRKIISARAVEHWRQIDIVSAAQLANLHVNYNKTASQLDVEGYIVAGARNPAFDVSEKLLMQINRMSRALSLTGMPTDKATIANAKKSEQEAQEGFGSSDKEKRQAMSLFAL